MVEMAEQSADRAVGPGAGIPVADLHHRNHKLSFVNPATRWFVQINQMQPSIFNVRVPLPARNEVFLMNTLTDAQLVVSPDVTDLLDRFGGDGPMRPDH